MALFVVSFGVAQAESVVTNVNSMTEAAAPVNVTDDFNTVVVSAKPVGGLTGSTDYTSTV